MIVYSNRVYIISHISAQHRDWVILLAVVDRKHDVQGLPS